MIDLRNAMGVKDFTWGDALSDQDPRKSLKYIEVYNRCNRERNEEWEVRKCSDAANKRIEHKRRVVEARQCIAVFIGIGLPLAVNALWWAK